MLLGGGETVNIVMCTDGSSNTMIVGEQSGNQRTSVWTDYMSGWSCGHNCNLTVSRINQLWTIPINGGDTTASIASYVYPIRTGLTVIVGSPNPISNPSYGTNNTQFQVPLTSRHTRGVNICLADGSVRFLNDNVDATVARQLAVRNDGTAISGDF